VVAPPAPRVHLLDRTGQVIATRGPKHGHGVRLEELPPYLPKAFLAAEDRRFYDHNGVDGRSIVRALGANMAAGDVVQGGSTLTQQLAKTIFLSPEQTLKRKMQEAVLAIRLERVLTKDEVLSLYLGSRLLRGERLRSGGCGAHLLRQAGEGGHPFGGRLAGGSPQGADQTRPHQRPRRGAGALPAGAGPDARRRVDQRGAGAGGAGDPAGHHAIGEGRGRLRLRAGPGVRPGAGARGTPDAGPGGAADR
jgi:hypothetical protein